LREIAARRANQQNLSSPFAKNISLNPSGKSALSLATSHPGKGRFAIVTNAGWDAVDAAASGAQACSQGGLAVSEQQARRTNGVCCVRQNRVVPTPVAGAKLSVAASIRPDRSAIKPAATVTRRIRRRGEHGISRKAIAQGMSDCLR
jgi:hypothetical protein